MKYFEDVVVGERAAFGAYHVTREEVLAFARQYDPQPFHLSDEGAAGTHFGRLCASGWHTGAMAMRMLVDQMQTDPRASLGSPGLEDLRWVRPVYPGDTLKLETEVLAKRRSQSRNDLGLVQSRTSVLNQRGEVVMTMTSTGMIALRRQA